MSEAERDALDDQHNQSQGLNLKGKQTLSRVGRFFTLIFFEVVTDNDDVYTFQE